MLSWCRKKTPKPFSCRYLENLCSEAVHTAFASSALHSSIGVYSELWLFKLNLWNTAKWVHFLFWEATIALNSEVFPPLSISTREHYQLHCWGLSCVYQNADCDMTVSAVWNVIRNCINLLLSCHVCLVRETRVKRNFVRSLRPFFLKTKIYSMYTSVFWSLFKSSVKESPCFPQLVSSTTLWPVDLCYCFAPSFRCYFSCSSVPFFPLYLL